MAAALTRRAVLGGMAVSVTAIPGCVRLSGCEDQSKYILILTAVDSDVVRTEPIAYQNLSADERRLVEKTLDQGRYETCPWEASDDESRAFYAFGDRVESHRADGYAYLEYEERQYQIGLVLSAVYYALTEHHPTGTPEATEAATTTPQAVR
jgi:hypothetical protein